MKTKLASITCLTLVAAALAMAPAVGRAQDNTNMPAAQTPPAKPHIRPLHGKVASVDSAAMTFTVKNSTIAITSNTKIFKNDQPAVFADITVGASVSVAYNKDADGKMNATTVRIGEKKKKAEAAPAPATNAPPAQ